MDFHQRSGWKGAHWEMHNRLAGFIRLQKPWALAGDLNADPGPEDGLAIFLGYEYRDRLPIARRQDRAVHGDIDPERRWRLEDASRNPRVESPDVCIGFPQIHRPHGLLHWIPFHFHPLEDLNHPPVFNRRLRDRIAHDRCATMS